MDGLLIGFLLACWIGSASVGLYFGLRLYGDLKAYRRGLK